MFDALGLVLNVVVLWNTVHLEAIVKHLRQQGYSLRDEDIAHLSPLGLKVRAEGIPQRTPDRRWPRAR